MSSSLFRLIGREDGMQAPRGRHRKDYLSLAIPRRAASAAAWPRERTPSLRRIDDTWWATVFSERNRCEAISALRRPLATRASPSSSRVVSPAGLRSVDALGPPG